MSQASLAVANSNSRGVASNVDGSRLWVLDSNKVVYVYDANQILLGSWTVSGLKTPTGISVSGSDVWISDSGNDRVYRHNGGASRLSGTFSASNSFALASANNNPQDLVTDGTTIWVTQSGSSDRVYVYSTLGASLGYWTLPTVNTSPVGITLDPTGTSKSLWVVDDTTDRVYEYADARVRRSGTQAAAVTFTLNASNGNAQGIADPRSLAARDALFADPTFSAAASDSITTAFQSLNTNAMWPVSGTTFNEVESTFGPRIKVSTSAYDWHRGIDIDAPEGTPVLSPVAGTLFDVKNYVDGGLTVILKHAFTNPVSFAGKTLTHYYTYYMHLSSVDPILQAAADSGQTPSVPQGFQIGTVGHSGTAVGDHLHWELRVGTPYSLEWQLANPTSQYGANNFGFDPHVHPMLLTVPTATNTLAASVTTKPTNKIDGRVRISTDDEQPLFNRVQVRVVKKSTNTAVANHVLDLNERLGFNATTNVLLDTPDKTKPYFAPTSFGTSSATWGTDVVIPKTWIGSNFGTKFQTIVTVTDIWGRTKTISW
jgi:murein DD-endopeptidase MepM/ murein hydrolase activator NlpD